MIDLHRYCFSCMQELQERDGICPVCRYDNRLRSNGTGYLPCCVLNDRYVIGKALGRGGFGVTYLGLDSVLSRKVAVKEYYPTDLSVREAGSLGIHPFEETKGEFERGINRVIREAKIAAGMDGIPNIVRTYELLKANGTVYLIMEYVEGITLAQHIRQGGGKLSWIQAWPLLKPVMAALGKVHRKGIVHRDVSPDNIMVRFADGSPVLLDFGAAQAATTGATEHSVNLKMGYAPLEQYSTMGQQDGRSDMYSMMATLYYTLTGKQPVSPLNVATGIEKVIPPSELGSDIPEEAEEVLLKGMSTRIEDRYRSMEELVEAFEEAGRNGRTMVVPDPVPKPPESTTKPKLSGSTSTEKQTSKKKSRKWMPIFVTALVALLAGGATVSFFSDKLMPSTISQTKIPVVGETYVFGKYEQDNQTSNGKEDIEWLVLDQKGTSVLLISRYALDCQPYNTTYKNVTWETCSLRSWLNETFLNEAFSIEELKRIQTTEVIADRNPLYSTDPGNDTRDRVFLLSIEEAERYFALNKERKCAPTEYAIARGAYTNKNDNKASCWWLRSPGFYQCFAALVSYDGSRSSGSVHYDNRCVRPAFWINLES